MISAEAFAAAWQMLHERFPRAPEHFESYHAWLDERMDTDAFVLAAEHLWATARFFPRPIDFLLVEAEREWKAVLAALHRSNAHPDFQASKALLEIGGKARSAVYALGGIEGAQNALQRDPVRFKAAWLEAYEAEDVPALPAGPARKEIAPPRG